MTDNKNPLIQEYTKDTLHHAHCVLLLLEELHAAEDSTSLQDHNINMGMLSLLQCANSALAYELGRINLEGKEQNS
jgi:hypothetical protein